MAQMSGLLTSLAEARPEEHNVAAANPRPDYEDLGGEVGATTAEIFGCLHQYATSTRLDLPRKVANEAERSTSTSEYEWCRIVG